VATPKSTSLILLSDTLSDKQDVLGLDVAVHDPQAVTVQQGLHQGLAHAGALRLRQAPLGHHAVEESPPLQSSITMWMFCEHSKKEEEEGEQQGERMGIRMRHSGAAYYDYYYYHHHQAYHYYHYYYPQEVTM